MATSNTSRLSAANVFLIGVVSILIPLLASVSMASTFLASLGQGTDKPVLFLVSAAIIFSSVVLGHLIGLTLSNNGPVWIVGMCIAVWCGVITFSTSTSALSFLNSSSTTIANQIEGSAKGQSVQNSINQNINAIQGLQEQIDKAHPVQSRSKRERWAEQIAGLQASNITLYEMQSRMTRDGEGSAVAQSFNKLERYGITRDRLAMLAAVLLDAIPFACSIGISFLMGRRKGKKSQATGKPHLQAVA